MVPARAETRRTEAARLVTRPRIAMQPQGPSTLPGDTDPDRARPRVRHAREAWTTPFCQDPICVSCSPIRGPDLHKRRGRRLLRHAGAWYPECRERGQQHMVFKVGETVVYPHHGAARIEEIKTRTVRGEE